MAEDLSAPDRSARGPVAILPWGDLIEDFLDPLDITIDEFADQMSGGWLFGFVDALKTAGIGSIIVCFSEGVRHPARMIHRATGAPIFVLPATPLYRTLRKRMRDPSGWTVAGAFGPATGARRVAYAGVLHLIPYLATPAIPLARALRAEGCSWILCQEYEYPRFDACVAVGRALGLPTLGTFQGGTAQRSFLERYFRPSALRFSAGILVGSAVETTRVRRRYGASVQVHRLPNPVDVADWVGCDARVARAELGIEEDADVVAWHGRVDIGTKGLDILLDAWEWLLRRRPDRSMRLLLIGSGADSERLRMRLAETRNASVIWIDQYVNDRSILGRHLSAADVYAFPSRREGFPVAPIEAMACGLPVVASDVAGMAEILVGGEESGGVVVPVGDSVALAEQIARILDDDSLCAELGRRARRRAETGFSKEVIGAQLAGILTSASDALATGRQAIPQ